LSVKITLTIKEIKKIMCKRCREKLKRLVQSKISEELAKQVLEGE